MATKPTNTYRWAQESGGTKHNIVEPSSGHKDEGWLPGRGAIAQFFNWLANGAHEWILYLKDAVFVGEAGQPGATITGGIGAGGKGLVVTAGGTNENGIDVTPSGTGHGVNVTSTTGQAINATTSGGGAALKGTNTGSGAGALVDASAGSGVALQVVGNGTQPAATFNGGAGQQGATFANGTSATGAARQNAARLVNGDLDLSNVAIPASTTSLVNVLTNSAIPKCWGAIQITNASPFVPSVDAGLNIDSVTRQGANTLRVVFAGDMVNTNYAVAAHYIGAISGVMLPIDAAGTGDGRATTHVDLTAVDWTGAAISLDNRAGLGGVGTLKIMLSVHGNQ